MFPNTTTIQTNNGDSSPVDLARRQTNNPADLGKFVSPDGLLTLEIRQKSTRGRKRHEVVLTRKKVATDPLTSTLSEVSASAIIALDQPKLGFTVDDLWDMHRAIAVWIMYAGSFESVVTGDT